MVRLYLTPVLSRISFANAVVSPAIEFKNEGYILGVGAKIFTIAGPVIMYGTIASVIYGVIYWFVALF
ncbi:MAG: SpoVA/SpoVAEb family sporulation membrane protein [Clostridia bacterium]|nr:SpoVA/SpoVAEb family sporulation membrane protein [Clostridia bacterium]